MAGALEDLRVLDLSWGMAGPMTTMFLADNGADVIRIESPLGDPFAQQTGYRVWNRGKRSARLDLQSDEGRRQFEELVRTSDVVVDSFSLGTTDTARHRPRLSQSHSIPVSSPVRSPPTGSTPRTVTVPATTGWSRPGPAFSMTRRDGGGRPWSSSMAVPVPTPSSVRPRGSSGAPIETVRSSRAPRGRASARPTSPHWGSLRRCALDRSAVWASVSPHRCLQGALAAACLNWQRVEEPGCAAVLDVARRLEVDRGPLRMCGRQMGPSLDTPPPVGPGRGRRRHALSRRARHFVPGRSRSCLDGVRWDVGGHLPPRTTGGGIQEIPRRRVGPRGGGGGTWHHHRPAAGRGASRQVVPRRWLRGRGRRSGGGVDSPCGAVAGVLGHARLRCWASAAPRPAHGGGARCDPIRAWDAPVLPRTLAEPLAHPLAGIRVLDLGLGVAGPFTGRALADLGADVIKINALYDKYWNGTHMGLGVNRGKRSIALNLKDPDGREVLEKLLQRSDVITLNWRPGAAARLGLDYETLRDRYPRLVYCNTRGYEKGPRSDLPGTDQNAAAMTGTEWEDGACDAGNPPLWSRSNMGDTGNALLAAIAIAIALYHRDKTGEGQAVSTSIVNAGTSAHVLRVDPCGRRRNRTGGTWTAISSGSPPTTGCIRARSASGSSWRHSRVEAQAKLRARCFRARPPADDAESVAALAQLVLREHGGGRGVRRPRRRGRADRGGRRVILPRLVRRSRGQATEPGQ